MAKKPQVILDIPVEFGGVSIGEATCRLGVRINRDVCNIVLADEVFCGHRLTGKVILGGSDEMPNQTRMIDSEYSVEGSFDVKRIGVSAGQISTGLTFSLADIDVSDLAKFSKGAGRLIVEGVGEIPADAPDEHEEDKEPRNLKVDEPLRDVQLDKIFGGDLLKGLKGGGLDTVGALADYTTAKKRLTDLPGIGPGKADEIADTMVEFYKQNPQA
jgi:hypothetical protein